MYIVSYNAISLAIKEKRFWKSVQRKIGQYLIDGCGDFVVTRRPRWLPDDTVISTEEHDYIRFATLELICQEIIKRSIPGNIAELGVYRGDFSRVMNYYFPDRKLYLFDTFEGFDGRDTIVDKEKKLSTANQDFSETSVDYVLSRMEFPECCIVKKGYFPATGADVNDIFALVSLDVDLYAPILSGLEFFYPKLASGGMMIIHDFGNANYLGVSRAVREYADKNSIGYVCLPDECGSVVIVK